MLSIHMQLEERTPRSQGVPIFSFYQPKVSRKMMIKAVGA